MEAATTTTRQVPKEHTLVHFEIPAGEPTKVARFYEQLFNWKFNKWEGGNTDYWLIVPQGNNPDDTIGGLYKRNNPQEGFLNYFLVKSIDSSLQKATQLGAKIVTQKQEIPNMGWFAVLTDPDGNTFAFYQSKSM